MWTWTIFNSTPLRNDQNMKQKWPSLKYNQADYHYTNTILHSHAKKLRQILHTYAKRAIKYFQGTPVRLSNKYRLTGRQLWNSHNSREHFRLLSIPIDYSEWRYYLGLYLHSQSKRLKYDSITLYSATFLFKRFASRNKTCIWYDNWLFQTDIFYIAIEHWFHLAPQLFNLKSIFFLC